MFARALSSCSVLATAFTVLAQSPALLAQTGTIAGKVTDRTTQQPIAEVLVQVPGTALETQTNKEGDYRISNVRPGRRTVAVFRLGFKAASDTVQIIPGQTITLDLQMTPSLVTLSEMVITGTAGNQERRAQSAQVASLTATQIMKVAPVSNVGELLQSRIPSVAVNSGSGSVGTAKTIRIRGASSINLSNQPLLFIDGVRINEGLINYVITGEAGAGTGQRFDRMNDLSPDEIESVEVVKGPAAATLYGADASAGVIQIFTKKGRPGANRFAQNLRLEYGRAYQDWTPPDNYGLCTVALVAATSTNPLCRGQAVGALVRDNPLVRVGALRDGNDRQFGWNGRGGGQNYGYNLSFGTQDASGNLPKDTFERYNIRSNFNYIPDSRLTIEAGLGLLQSKAQLPSNDNNLYGWLFGGGLGSPLTRSDAAAPSPDGWFGFNRHYNAIKSIDRVLLTHRVTGNLMANFLPVSWFSNRFILGVDYAGDDQHTFYPKNDSSWYGGLTDRGNMFRVNRGDERYTFDYLGNLRRTYGARNQWEGNLSFGAQVISSRNTALTSSGLGFVTNDNNTVSAAATTTGGESFTEQRQLGYLGQLQVGYQNRVFLQFGVRVDKNSAFGSQAPAFVLPKVGGSWTISEERFFDGFTKYVNTLRLRASWGTTGRSPAPGAALTTLVAAPFNIDGTTRAGAIPGNPGNAALKPERGVEFEAGFDASFWKERITAELTYFDKTTTDLIIARPIPPSLGFSSFPLANIGAVINKGLEFALNVTAVQMKNFGWDIRAGANTLHNELTDLGGLAPFSVSPVGASANSNRALVGQQLGVYVSKKIQSIDVANSKVIVSDTLAPNGNLYPTLEWNITNGFTVMKDVRITALIDSKRNFVVKNFTDLWRETQLVRSRRRLDPTALSRYEFLRRYGSDTPGQPAFVTVTGKTATSTEVTDAFLQPGDFVRFRELSVTYSVPQKFLSSVRNAIEGASITFAMQNVKLWTKYEGPDPEVVSDTQPFSRLDFFTLPLPKKTVLRANFTF